MRSYDELTRALAHYPVALETYGEVSENGRVYPLVRATVPGERWLVITAGFHGEEPAGPLALADHLGDLAAFARAHGVGLRIYPCINPSGFEAGTRYNASGERPNNDFLRYELAPDQWAEKVAVGQQFLRWRLHDGGPRETRPLRADLDRFPAPAAALDLHQDNYLPEQLTYAYVFGEAETYRPLVTEAGRVLPVARHRAVDDSTGTDGDGLIVLHDGSVTDYFHRRGVPYTAALETTTAAPMDKCIEVAVAWIEGFIVLAARP